MAKKLKLWIAALRKRRPPAAEHRAPHEGARWPAHAVPVVVLIVDLVDITDKVLGLLRR